MKNNRGFTFIELLAVIIILGIVALIAMPTITTVIETSKKNALKASANNILKAVKRNCEEEKIEGKNITRLYNINDGVLSTDLEITSLPTSGLVTVNNKCKATVSVVEGNYCVVTNGFDTTVNTNTVHCGEAEHGSEYTEPSCFIFNASSKTITGYHFEDESCPTEISIPASINNVPVEHIGDFAFVNVDYDEIAYAADDNEYYTFKDIVKENILKYPQFEFYNIILLNRIVESPKKVCYLANGNSVEYDADYVLTNSDVDKYVNCGMKAGSYESINTHGVITKVNLASASNLKTIGEAAFMHNQITKIDFGEDSQLTSIGLDAFFNNLLTGTLDLSMLNLTSIGGFGDNDIAKVILPSTVIKVSNTAFASNMIDEIVFNDKIEEVGMYAFEGNELSGTFTLPSTILEINTLSFSNNKISSLVLNNQIERLGAYSFSQNSLLENITFGNNLQTIGIGAFSYDSLTSLELNENLTSIEYSAFYGNKLTSISFNDNITTLGAQAFADNSGTIANLTIPGSIVIIPDALFANTKITNLTLQDGTTTIGTNAFSRSNIRNITWGNTIRTIKNQGFNYCSFTTFSMPSGVTSIGGGAFMYSHQNISDTEITIPETINKIDYSVFYGLSGPNLTTINIGNNITSIGSNAFFNVHGSELETINISSNINTIASTVFTCTNNINSSLCDYAININKPEGSVSGAPWSNPHATIVWAAN